MLRAGALPVLLRLIAADNMMVIEVATMVLALLCIEWEAKLDAIKLNAIPLLVNLLEKKCKVTTRTAAAAALMHISVEISGKAKAVEAGIVHALAASLDEDEDKLLVYCLQCIANIGESKATEVSDETNERGRGPRARARTARSKTSRASASSRASSDGISSIPAREA